MSQIDKANYDLIVEAEKNSDRMSADFLKKAVKEIVRLLRKLNSE